MKKNFCKLMALVVVALMMMSTIALANPAVDVDDVAATTVTLTGLTANEEATVLVVKAGTVLTALTNADIIFIDQVTIGSDGTATFDMDVSNGLAANGGNDAIDVYCGYTSMSGDALSSLGVALVTKVEAKYNLEVSEMYTQTTIFNKDGFRRVFLKLASELNPAEWTLKHSDSASKIFYSVEREGYDCILKTTATDVAGVIAEITAENVAPATELTIAMYGDLTGDSTPRVNLADIARVKKGILAEFNDAATYTDKYFVTGDATNDSKVNLADIARIKKYILSEGTEKLPVSLIK